MCRPMKKRNLTLLILINIMVGSAGADELGSATESAAIQSLLQSVAQQQELMAIQTEQLERQEQQISEQSERLQSMEDQLRQLVMANNGATMSPSEHPGEVIQDTCSFLARALR